MALTIADLLRIPGLDLGLVAGVEGVSKPIRWVHATELQDPTPFLRGGELLLTTGMGVGKTRREQRAYVQRLCAADLSGLGFGVGFGFPKTPRGILEAADRASFPVFEVPYPVPFIAITEAVFTRLVAEQYDVLSRSLEAEHTLTRAVLEGRGTAGVIASLARATGGWALLLDRHGRLLEAFPGSARRHRETAWNAVRSRRGEGLHFSLSLLDRGHHVAVQPVASEGRIEAFLTLGKGEALSQFDRIVSNHALALLAIELAKARAVAEAERRLKGDVLDQLVSGSFTRREARTAIERLAFDPASPLLPIALSGPGDRSHLALTCEDVLAARGVPFLCSPRDDFVLAVVQPHGGGFLEEIRRAVEQRWTGTVRAGAGSPVPLDELRRGIREARYALEVCRTEGRLHAEFSDLGTYQLLLSLQDPDALRTFAASVLSPLDRYDEAHGGELISSLRAFLDCNARWEVAASHLFVHRHTLRYRMRKVEELTGRDLSSARDRMEFFLALRARELLASGEPAMSDFRPTRGDGNAAARSGRTPA